jgi:hypothetical protein
LELHVAMARACLARCWLAEGHWFVESVDSDTETLVDGYWRQEVSVGQKVEGRYVAESQTKPP